MCRVGKSFNVSFPVRAGLRQRCVMSLWLFNVYVDGVVRELNERMPGRGLSLANVDGREWTLNRLLLTDMLQ